MANNKSRKSYYYYYYYYCKIKFLFFIGSELRENVQRIMVLLF
jgi:hypothetical protein